MDASRWAVLAQPGCRNEGEYQVNYRHTLSLQNLALPHVLTLNQLVHRDRRQGDSVEGAAEKNSYQGRWALHRIKWTGALLPLWIIYRVSKKN